ncbi:hypothetical protein [Azohydromonas aeria]|uniref:hypothetical protein n=1 Tax=Azohydromonas aeria TaxID=2590212 RepID=UPI0012F985D0|nr:hypothetical protein [Azohydromonas aeria]
MFSMLEQQPPELLHAVYARLSRRYAAPGVRLSHFAGRWQVFRTADLAAGNERAVIDVEPPHDHTVEDLAELESRAAFAVGEDHDATLVVMHLATRLPLSGDEQATPSLPVLTVSVWSLEHPVALTGDIELDEAGAPVRIGLPGRLPRS